VNVNKELSANGENLRQSSSMRHPRVRISLSSDIRAPHVIGELLGCWRMREIGRAFARDIHTCIDMILDCITFSQFGAVDGNPTLRVLHK
jgi:hypothetical protein